MDGSASGLPFSGDTALEQAGVRLQAARAADLRAELDQLRHLMAVQDRALSGRFLRVARMVRAVMRGRDPFGRPLTEATVRLWARIGRDGVGPALAYVGRAVFPRGEIASPGGARGGDEALPVAPAGWTPMILVIAELSLSQCAKYRVWQRVEQMRMLGWDCRVVDWRHTEEALGALQFCTGVVFYRVPAFASVQGMLDEVRRLAVPSWWEVDDLIFDRDLYARNGNLAMLSKQERGRLLFGAGLFRACMLGCGRGIASTPVLAQAMRDAGVADVAVIDNALDAETLDAAGAVLASRSPRVDDEGAPVIVIYGSGTRTHDADFLMAAPGLVAAMAEDARLVLWIVGELALPPCLLAMGERVVVLPGRPYAEYLALMARADIAIAPLEDSVFNDAKSNIKYLEAAAVGVPLVCSPRRAFADVIVDGQTGLLAATDAAWTRALLVLAADGALRRAMGERARADVAVRYAPALVAETQVRAVFGAPPPVVRDGRLRVLCVNVYYPPRAFGGATHVAVEMVERLRASGRAELSVFTTRPGDAHDPDRPAAAMRYTHGGVPVVAVDLPATADPIIMFHHPAATVLFEQHVAAFRPDVVHLHATQGLGVGLVDVCRARGIPYVITLHDAWWVCERQFMVRRDGRFCGQKRIDLRACRRCCPEARHLEDRAVLAGAALRDAALLLSPSVAHRDLHLANGVDPARIVVHRNGFRWPVTRRARRPEGVPLRFGYVGGVEAVKGYPLVRAAFEALERGDWSLRLVDNKTMLGMKTIDVGDWRTRGTVEVVPAYDYRTIDAFFDSIDILLFPSGWPESYGLTVREALARDVWVIASAPGGQAEDIVAGVNGTLIGLAAEPGELVAAVTALLDRPDRLVGHVNPCKSQLVTWQQQAATLLELLQGVAGSWPAGLPAGRG
ncbi:glycosyltransferase [Gluconacetobacter takamatsuzukensis]|uniref:Glycosyltransferase n=1 Tax=Gluconacetobacter takamatsuzukensis TaxID=1286190 RepID=A0A7W4KF14_9PROT|nr:glycosyltransferase [Gluconacetobacter takamatsuzukensis]MBB2205752.1 glycosyltransferase [Gluconacetobacter takamatsuzukensis]